MMAKSTKASGDTYTEEELADPTPPLVIHRAMLGGEPSPETEDGTGSSPSSESERTSSAPKPQPPRNPAPTTENRSNPQGTAGSSVVHSTATPGLTTDPESTEDFEEVEESNQDTVDHEDEEGTSSKPKATTPTRSTKSGGTRKAATKDNSRRARVRSTDGDFDDFE
jgi:hypothetical protein